MLVGDLVTLEPHSHICFDGVFENRKEKDRSVVERGQTTHPPSIQSNNLRVGVEGGVESITSRLSAAHRS